MKIERLPNSLTEATLWLRADAEKQVRLMGRDVRAALVADDMPALARAIINFSGAMEALADRRRVYLEILTPSMQ